MLVAVLRIVLVVVLRIVALIVGLIVSVSVVLAATVVSSLIVAVVALSVSLNVPSLVLCRPCIMNHILIEHFLERSEEFFLIDRPIIIGVDGFDGLERLRIGNNSRDL